MAYLSEVQEDYARKAHIKSSVCQKYYQQRSKSFFDDVASLSNAHVPQGIFPLRKLRRKCVMTIKHAGEITLRSE